MYVAMNPLLIRKLMLLGLTFLKIIGQRTDLVRVAHQLAATLSQRDGMVDALK